MDVGSVQPQHHELTIHTTLQVREAHNACVKQLLARVHEGILWMDRPMPINVNFIATIIGLPMDGEKTKQYLEENTKEKVISDEIKEKYGIERSNRGIKINDINDPATRFATRLLGWKFMCK
jgi:hypothetical protein